MITRYAPAREDGCKPYVVVVQEWGQIRERLVYARSGLAAEIEARGQSFGAHVRAHRATRDDLERLT